MFFLAVNSNAEDYSDSGCRREILNTIEKGSEVVVTKKDKTIIEGTLVDISQENLILGSLDYSGSKYLSKDKNFFPIEYNQISQITSSIEISLSKRKQHIRNGMLAGALVGTVIAIIDYRKVDDWYEYNKKFDILYVVKGIAAGGILGLITKSGRKTRTARVSCN